MRYHKMLKKLCALFNSASTVSETEIVAAIGKKWLKRMERRGVIETCMAFKGIPIYAMLPYNNG